MSIDRPRKVEAAGVTLIRALLYGAVFGILIMLALTVLFSILMVSNDMSQSILVVLSGIACSLGAFSAGFAAAKKFKSRGFLIGALSALLIFLLILALGLILSNPITLNAAIKLILVVLFGSIGGIMGINIKKRRK